MTNEPVSEVDHLKADLAFMIRERDAALERADQAERDQDEILRNLTAAGAELSRAQYELGKAERALLDLRSTVRCHPVMRGTVGLYGTPDEFTKAVGDMLDWLADRAEVSS